MLLPFVSWLYGTPSPDTPPYSLLPNMSESSGTPGENRARGFFRLSVSLAEPCLRLTPVITIIWVGEWVSCKKPPFSFSSSGEPSHYFPATEGSRFLFGDRFASIELRRRLDRAVEFARFSQCVAAGVQPLPASQCGFHPSQPLNHIARLPLSLWDSEVVGWVVRCAWLNQNNVFVGMMRAQCIEHAPSDDASFLNLCFSRSGHGYAPVGCRIGGSTTSLSAIGARRFVVLFSADDDRQFAPFAPCSLVPRGA